MMRFALVSAGLLAACGVAPAQGWGTVKGKVVLAAGEALPARPELNVNTDKQACLQKGAILSEEWVVDKNTRGIKNALVWLTPATAGNPLPIHPELKDPAKKQVEIDQPCCAFVPHIVGIRVGQELVLKNSATIAHNANYNIGNDSGNPLIPAGGTVVLKDLQPQKGVPGSLSCTIHGWMKGYVRVFDHPYFAVTDDKGEFEMKNAPAGDFKLVVWHEAIGWRGGKEGRKGIDVKIPAEGTVDLGGLDLKLK